MATIASPAAYVAAVAALLLSGIGAGLPIDRASADDNCAGAPGAAAPAGQHWYYRIDRVKQRKCWYLHTIMALPGRAAAKHRAVSSEPADSEPAASEPVASDATPQLPVAAAPFAAAPQSAFAAIPQLPYAATPQAANAAPAPQLAAEPSSEVVSSQPAPHVTMLAIRPVAAPFAGTASEPEAATPEQTADPPTQIAPNSANAPVDAAAKPADGANPAPAPGATDAPRALASADAAAIAARTHLADVFLLLALALGLAAVLIALCGKMAGRARTPRRSGYPGDVWRRDIHEDDAPLLAPREPYGPAGLAAHERIERSPPAPANVPAARRAGGEPRRSAQVGTNLKDIELALRALRDARQSMTQT
jgi:hypothetical protein